MPHGPLILPLAEFPLDDQAAMSSDPPLVDILCDDGSTSKFVLLTTPLETVSFSRPAGADGDAAAQHKEFQPKDRKLGWAKNFESSELIAYVQVASAKPAAGKPAGSSKGASAASVKLEELASVFAKKLFENVDIELAIQCGNMRDPKEHDETKGGAVRLPFMPSALFDSKRAFYTWKKTIIDWWRANRRFFRDNDRKLRPQHLYATFCRTHPRFRALENSRRWLQQVIAREQQGESERAEQRAAVNAERRGYAQQAKGAASAAPGAATAAGAQKRKQVDDADSDGDEEEGGSAAAAGVKAKASAGRGQAAMADGEDGDDGAGKQAAAKRRRKTKAAVGKDKYDESDSSSSDSDD